MREIKFRAWDSRRGEWSSEDQDENYDVGLLATTDGAYVIDCYDYIKLCMYTGLHDKNGTEIYEGDIVDHPWQNEGKHSVVIFSSGGFRIQQSDMDGVAFSSNEWDRLVVIGNVYENEELRK